MNLHRTAVGSTAAHIRSYRSGFCSNDDKGLFTDNSGRAENIFQYRDLGKHRQTDGIDPTTGKEVFIKKDGTTTFEWNSADQVVCGDAQPTFQGNFGSSARWGNLDANISFAYKFGGQTYNSTLVEKVENVDVNNWNVDRRVLTERWNTPGQVAKYKSIKDTSTTKPTSRFVEDFNELAFSVISVGYDFSSFPLIQKSPLNYLKLSATMNDIGRLSTVKKEWGTSYPRARQFSFTLSARF